MTQFVGIPVVSNDNRSLQAAVAAFFFTPLIIILIENSMSEECLISGYLVSDSHLPFLRLVAFLGRYLYCH